jgi:hypothetical protein
MLLKNFLLIHYDKTRLDIESNPILDKNYLQIQDKCFYWMINQLNKFYPNSKIHILTNKNININGCYIHKKDIPNNHNAKFWVYSTILEPVMYLDCDIKINRPFSIEDLTTNTPFKLYQKSNTNLSGLFHDCNFETYNAGCIYIKEPNQSITEELQKLEKEHFNDKEKLKSIKLWPFNDEYALSIYIKNNNWIFEESLVSVPFYAKNDILKMAQSIHYTGIYAKEKLKQEMTINIKLW